MRGQTFASNDEAVAYMKSVAVDASGFTAFLGVEPLRCFQGEAELLLALRPDMTQHHGFAHGAIVGLMADNACAWAASSAHSPGGSSTCCSRWPNAPAACCRGSS